MTRSPYGWNAKCFLCYHLLQQKRSYSFHSQTQRAVHTSSGYPPPLVLNLEPEGPQRFPEMYVQCVGTAIVISFFNKIAGDWIKKGSTVQVRLPSASSMVS